jgi:hypothetical protein
MDNDREQRIRERAYKLWEQAGQPDGGADAFWYQAELELTDENVSDEVPGTEVSGGKQEQVLGGSR